MGKRVLLMPTLIEKVSKIYFIKMKMFNNDGQEAEMCGNALRCVAKLVHDSKLIQDDIICIQTKAGPRKAEISADSKLIKVNMGRAMGMLRISSKSYFEIFLN